MNVKSLILTVLGSGTAIPYQNRVSASYLLQTNKVDILFDTGFFVGYQLDKISLSIKDLDIIFLTHKHPDHFMGLFHLLFQMKSLAFERSKPLKLVGFKGLKDYMEKFQNLMGEWVIPDSNFEIIEETKGRISNILYSLYPVSHKEESIAIRLEINGKIIFYTSDTEYFDDLPLYAENSDLLISDCAALPNKKIKGHMNYLESLKLADKSKSKMLLLSHFYPNSDNFTIFNPDYKFKIFKARDLMQINI